MELIQTIAEIKKWFWTWTFFRVVDNQVNNNIVNNENVNNKRLELAYFPTVIITAKSFIDYMHQLKCHPVSFLYPEAFPPINHN